jgi:OHCU decarboxylase
VKGARRAAGVSNVDVERLNALSREAAEQALLACCGSRAWARRVAAARPFEDFGTLVTAARADWWSLGQDAWLEAFAAHPRIGERVQPHDRAARWSASEQVGADRADAGMRERLARGNDAYFDRFGFIFIVCATGKTADEMVAMLESRLANDRETELRVAAEEQMKIAELRLRKWLTE